MLKAPDLKNDDTADAVLLFMSRNVKYMFLDIDERNNLYTRCFFGKFLVSS